MKICDLCGRKIGAWQSPIETEKELVIAFIGNCEICDSCIQIFRKKVKAIGSGLKEEAREMKQQTKQKLKNMVVKK